MKEREGQESGGISEEEILYLLGAQSLKTYTMANKIELMCCAAVQFSNLSRAVATGMEGVPTLAMLKSGKFD